MDILEQLREVIAQTLRTPAASIGATTRAADVPTWDSLGHVNLMMSLEQTFDIQLDVEDFPRLTSVPAILEQLKKQGIG
jgi:acyl carrier protein